MPGCMPQNTLETSWKLPKTFPKPNPTGPHRPPPNSTAKPPEIRLQMSKGAWCPRARFLRSPHLTPHSSRQPRNSTPEDQTTSTNTCSVAHISPKSKRVNRNCPINTNHCSPELSGTLGYPKADPSIPGFGMAELIQITLSSFGTFWKF